MISVEEALAKVLALATPMPAEDIFLAQAAGRWMASPAIAGRDQPPFDASAMDGYAVSGAATVGATYHVLGESGAGHAFAGTIGSGQAARIFTGAPVPQGATRVLLQEDVLRDGDIITVASASDNVNIRPQGNDFRTGAVVTPRLLRPNDLALLAAMNVPRLAVTRKPVVALIATGDELVMPGQNPGADQIICSNTFALKALADAAGAETRMLPIARDNVDHLRTVLDMALDADLIITVGGASVGDHDLVGRVAESMGLERAFYKIAMRPGKPLMAGRLQGRAMLGLPGNPVSAIVCGHLFMLPLIRAMLGDPNPAPQTRSALLSKPVAPTGPRTHYMRASLSAGGDGLPQIAPFADQDSALLGVLSSADALLIRPLGDAARSAGDKVSFLQL